MSKKSKIIIFIISIVVAFLGGGVTGYFIGTIPSGKSSQIIEQLQANNERLRQENKELKQQLTTSIGFTKELDGRINNAISLADTGIGLFNDIGYTTGDIRDTISNIRITVGSLKVNYYGIKEILDGIQTDCREFTNSVE